MKNIYLLLTIVSLSSTIFIEKSFGDIMRGFVRFLTLLLAVPFLLTIGGCANESNPQGEEYVLTGRILAIGDKIEIDITSGEYAYGIYHIIYTSAEISDRDGNHISISSLKTGDEIRVIYGGQVMMSYPPQVAAIRISLI